MTQPQGRGSTSGAPRATGGRTAAIAAASILVTVAFVVGGVWAAVGVTVAAAAAGVGRWLWCAHRAARIEDERWRHQSTAFAVDNGILAVHRDFFGLWNQGTPLARLATLNGTGQGPTRRR